MSGQVFSAFSSHMVSRLRFSSGFNCCPVTFVRWFVSMLIAVHPFVSTSFLTSLHNICHISFYSFLALFLSGNQKILATPNKRWNRRGLRRKEKRFFLSIIIVILVHAVLLSIFRFRLENSLVPLIQKQRHVKFS